MNYTITLTEKELIFLRSALMSEKEAQEDYMASVTENGGYVEDFSGEALARDTEELEIFSRLINRCSELLE